MQRFHISKDYNNDTHYSLPKSKNDSYEKIEQLKKIFIFKLPFNFDISGL